MTPRHGLYVLLFFLVTLRIGLAEAIENGYPLTADEVARSGLVQVEVCTVTGCPSTCTGMVLHSSQRSNDAWILTAAHCFFNVDEVEWNEGYPDIRPLNLGGVSVFDGLDASNTPGNLVGTATEAYTYPNWSCDEYPCDDVWYKRGKLDIALVHLNHSVEVRGPRWYRIAEYKRPFFCGRIDDYTGDGKLMLLGRGARSCTGTFGGDCQQDGIARRIRAESFSTAKDAPPTRHKTGYLEVDGSDVPHEAILRPGDSGGPWLYLPPDLNSGSERLKHSLNDGVVVAVFSGPNIDWGILTPSWPLADYSAAAVSGPNGRGFIIDKMGSDAFCVNSLPWSREAVWPWPWTWWERKAKAGERAAALNAATSSLP